MIDHLLQFADASAGASTVTNRGWAQPVTVRNASGDVQPGYWVMVSKADPDSALFANLAFRFAIYREGTTAEGMVDPMFFGYSVEPVFAGSEYQPIMAEDAGGTIVPAAFFGTHWNNLPVVDTPPTPWHDFGQKALRMWDTLTNWRHIETVKGIFDWSRTDLFDAFASAHGLEVLYCLGQAPDWATGGVSSGPSANYNILPPTNPADFGDFVGAVHARYPHWKLELWNEPPGFFSGTPAQLAELLRVGREEAPSAFWLGPGFTRGTSSLNFMAAFLAAIEPSDLDAVGFHPYVFPEPPERMIALAAAVRSMMAANGFGSHPLWATEWTWNTYYDDGDLVPTDGAVMPDDLASAYMARGLIIGAAGGYTRLFFYGPDHSWSKLRVIDLNDRSIRLPPADAAGYVSGLLSGATVGVVEVDDDGVHRVPYQKGATEGVFVWARDGETVEIPTDGFSAMTDIFGETIDFGATHNVTEAPAFAET